MKMVVYRLMVLLAAMLLLFCQSDRAEDEQHQGMVILFCIDAERAAMLTQVFNPIPGQKLLIYNDASIETACLFEVTEQNGTNVRKLIAIYPKAENVFTKALADMKSLYPSSSYGLVLFSRSFGWLPEGAYRNPQAFNESTSVESNEADKGKKPVKNIVNKDIRQLAACIPDSTFSFIVLEACHMTGIEVAYELKNKTEYILASSTEILVPGYTEAFGQSLNRLFDEDVKGFGEAAFSCFDRKTGGERSATISLLKTSALDELARWVKNNTAQSSEVSGIQHFDRNEHHLFFDFYDYYSRLTDSSKHALLKAILDKVVVWKAATSLFIPAFNGFEIKSHSGITSYIMQKDLPALNEEYTKLQWFNDCFSGKVIEEQKQLKTER